jgi:hypothetical protein
MDTGIFFTVKRITYMLTRVAVRPQARTLALVPRVDEIPKNSSPNLDRTKFHFRFQPRAPAVLP